VRTIRAMLLLAVTACIAVAFAVPAVASASNWTEEGIEIQDTEWQWSQDRLPLTSETSASFTGSFTFSGGIDCSVNGAFTLEPGSGTGVLNEFNLSSCTIKETLKALGCTKVTSATAALPKAYFASDFSGVRALRILNTEFNYVLEGGKFCPTKVSAFGDLTATPNNSKKISSFAFSQVPGFKTNLGTNPVVGGSISVSPAEKFGIIGTHIVDLSGNMNFAIGSCPVSGKLLLNPGSTGEIVSFNWNAPECQTFAWLKARGCTVSSMTSNSLPWTAKNEGTSIQLTGIDFTMEVFCSDTGKNEFYTLKGELSATPDNAGAISSTTLGGTLTGGWPHPSVGGTLNWSPAGQYGL
jgi:hypothetical protein